MMMYNKKQNLSEYKNCLLCALFTLAPNDIIFKSSTLIEKHNISTIIFLSKKKAIQKLSYTILQPFIGRNYNQTSLLKNYLKKYRYNYYYYFVNLQESTVQYSTNKQLNTVALQSLFLILGI